MEVLLHFKMREGTEREPPSMLLTQCSMPSGDPSSRNFIIMAMPPPPLLWAPCPISILTLQGTVVRAVGVTLEDVRLP